MSPLQRVYVIAEAGVNHNGSLALAFELVEAAARAGADAVKFQTFDSAALVSANAEKAAYQKKATGADESQLEMIRRLELSEADHTALIERCRQRGIDFLSAPFDLASIALLGRLGLTTLKLPSGAITDLPYLRAVGALGLPLIVSTGMSTLTEVADALEALQTAGTPRSLITLLHCTTEYPTPPRDVNLAAMTTLADEFDLPVGYSDHTQGITVPLAAVALGARVIEKHLTLDRTLPGPDHAASLEPGEFAEMVAGIRLVSDALGDPVKAPTAAELENAKVARKSIVAARDIRAGELLSAENLTTKRPGTGVSPMRWDAVVGTPAARDFARDEVISL